MNIHLRWSCFLSTFWRHSGKPRQKKVGLGQTFIKWWNISPLRLCVCHHIYGQVQCKLCFFFSKTLPTVGKAACPPPPSLGKIPNFFSEKLKWAGPLSSRWEQNTSELLNVFNLCIVRMMQAWTALYALYNQYRSDVKLHPCKTFRL